jgi:hypothetical protein
MMDWSLDRVFEVLKAPHGRPAVAKPDCTCGLNPLLVYFATMEQVLEEGLVLIQVDISHGPAGWHAADLASLKRAIDYVANREIGAFCAVCQHKQMPAHPAAVSAR